MQASKEHIDRAVSIARAYGASRVILLGSAVEAPDAARDLDLAVEGVKDWEFFGLADELASELPIKVDVIPLDRVEESHFTRTIKERGRVVYQADSQAEAEANGGR